MKSKKSEALADLTECEILRAMQGILGANGERWTQYRMNTPDGEFCLLGAFDAATKGTASYWRPSSIVVPSLYEAITDFCAANNDPSFGRSRITNWNDAPRRTWEDVRTVMLDAISRACGPEKVGIVAQIMRVFGR